MCRSVPQMPVFWTRIKTSLMPGEGAGVSSSQRPGLDCALIRAFIVFVRVKFCSACRSGNFQHPGEAVQYDGCAVQHARRISDIVNKAGLLDSPLPHQMEEGRIEQTNGVACHAAYPSLHKSLHSAS